MIFINRGDATQEEKELVEREEGDEKVYELKETGRKAVVLKAYTEGSDPSMEQGSMSSEYEYVFADIPVPEGEELVYNGDSQVGVEWSPFNSLTVEGNGAGGLKINEDGDAVATNQGTYTVTATLWEGLRWEADDKGYRPGRSKKVTFTIAGDSQSPSPQTITPKAKKANQVISAKKKVKKTVKLRGKSKKLKKTKTVKLKKLAKVSAKTKVVFKKANKAGGKKIVVTKNGKVKLKKGLKARTYKVKVKLTAPANKYYNAAKPKTIVLKVRIRK